MGISAMQLDDIQMVSEPYCSILCLVVFWVSCSIFFNDLPIFVVPMQYVQVSVLILPLFILFSCLYSALSDRAPLPAPFHPCACLSAPQSTL